jgi:hypothetical protein
MEDNKDRLLKMIEWLDQRRWNSKTNYNIIQNKVFNKELSNSEKILVHWLSYITDRQTPFENVWTKGGIVFSGIVLDYRKGHSSFIDSPFFDSGENGNSFFYKENKFSSRFITTDFKSILLTLKVLEGYNRNIIEYINKTYNKYSYLPSQIKEGNPVNLIAFILHSMSYVGIKNNKGKIQIKDYYLEVEKASQLNSELVSNPYIFKEKYTDFIKNRFSGKKRTWCCVRDYMKSYFKTYFLGALNELENHEDLKKVVNDGNQLQYLELPGDVWNLNSDFRESLLEPSMGKLSKKNLPKELREKMNKPFYPEQFDLTFDFVPRMCSHPNNKINRAMCKICIFGKSGMNQYCHSNSELLCPITMICCGYENMCDPKNCLIKKEMGKGLCNGLKEYSHKDQTKRKDLEEE